MVFRGRDHIQLGVFRDDTGLQNDLMLATVSRVIGQDLLRSYLCGNQSGTTGAAVRKPQGTYRVRGPGKGRFCRLGSLTHTAVNGDLAMLIRLRKLGLRRMGKDIFQDLRLPHAIGIVQMGMDAAPD